MGKLRAFFLLLCAAQFALIYGQQLKVKDFHIDNSDISAVRNKVLDANDEPCALIKVGLAEAGATFEGDIVGTPDYKDGEYWVYVIDGSNYLNVKTSKYTPLRYDFPEAVAKLKTYILTIEKPVTKDMPTGTVNILSNLEKVDIYVDGIKESNVAPFPYKGTEGKHIVELKASGYNTETREIDVTLGKAKSIRIDMFTSGSMSINGISYGMVSVSGSQYQMGSGDFYYEQPVHTVQLRPFSIGSKPVSVELWNSIMGTNNEYNKGANGEVVNVSYNECMDFISLFNNSTKRHFRLPTEAEWEYVRQNSEKLGVSDIGITMEWCSDWFGKYNQGQTSISPTGPAKGVVKVVRGGSLYGDGNWYKRPTYRWHQNPDQGSEKITLRLVEDN